MTDYDQVFFIGLPLLFIATLAAIGAYRGRDKKDEGAGLRFLVWFAVHAMLTGVCGLVGGMIVLNAFGWIPGTASQGGFDGSAYYFNWHDETYTRVSPTTWHVAYILEQATSGATIAGTVGFLGSASAIFLITRFLRPDGRIR